jgi:hypothetical protein
MAWRSGVDDLGIVSLTEVRYQLAGWGSEVVAGRVLVFLGVIVWVFRMDLRRELKRARSRPPEKAGLAGSGDEGL